MVVYSTAASITAPGIPSQQALVVHRNGQEKLIVESVIDGSGGDMAWIVPVPAEPSDVSSENRTLFAALDKLLPPEAVVRPEGPFLSWGVFVALFAALMLVAKRFRLVPALVLAFLVVTAYSFGLAGWSGIESNGAGASLGVNASDAKAVGNYIVQTLQADEAGGLNAWLTENGYHHIPDAGKPIVADYIKNGWRFVVAKLRSDTKGLLRPHPLSITFPTKTPVYPMRLTRLAGTDLQLDLYVLSDHYVQVAGMRVVIADEFAGKYRESRMEASDEKLLECESQRFQKHTSFPPLANLMGERCKLTRLHGQFTNMQLDHDFVIEPRQGEATLLSLYTVRGGVLTGLQWALMVGGALMLVGVLFSHLFVPSDKRVYARAVTACAGILVGTLLFVLIWSCIEVVPQRPRHDLRNIPGISTLGFDFRKKSEHFPADTSRETLEQEFLSFVQSRQYKNPYTGEAFEYGELLGGANLVQDKAGYYYLRTYDDSESMMVWDLRLLKPVVSGDGHGNATR